MTDALRHFARIGCGHQDGAWSHRNALIASQASDAVRIAEKEYRDTILIAKVVSAGLAGETDH